MLKDVNFALTYSTGLTPTPKEFFTESLIESNFFDLGLGFFSSSGIRCLAYGFALFIANGGRMRVVINNILSNEDKAAIINGKIGQLEMYEDAILNDVEKLCQILSREDEQFFRCFSYLIFQNRIEFIATVSTAGGLAHDKYGIFTDIQGNKVAFVGSANFSQTAMELNGETVMAFTSWNDNKRVLELEKIFTDTWKGDTPHLIHISLDKVKVYINKKFGMCKLSDLIAEEYSLRKDIYPSSVKNTLFSSKLVDKLDCMEREPRFPFIEERKIQKDAYQAWLYNNQQGIFAMATGSGKTVTALNCLLKDYKNCKRYKAIIVVPTQALALQWEREVEHFNFLNCCNTVTCKTWKEDISRFTTKSLLNSDNNIVIITTYATFVRKNIQTFIKNTKGIEDFVFIADEMHNLGSKGPITHLPINIIKRIGLSATPERVYDEVGSKILYDFFKSFPPAYTYRYTMKQAIEDGILCRYNYYPLFVSLTKKEMEEYLVITKKLRKFIDPNKGTYKKGAEMLLMRRKRIIHKATNKKIKVSELLNQLERDNNLDYTFVFVPEGYEPNYAENDCYNIDANDIHIIDEYADMFKEKGYRYHKYISGIDDSQSVLSNFASGDIQVLLSMKCLDEGVDIPRAEKAIFISSTGNPRQFIQRRGRVLRKSEGKTIATIWDLIVTPPYKDNDDLKIEKSMFCAEVKRIMNFAALAENKIDILYGDLHDICMSLNIDMFDILNKEEQLYN